MCASVCVCMCMCVCVCVCVYKWGSGESRWVYLKPEPVLSCINFFTSPHVPYCETSSKPNPSNLQHNYIILADPYQLLFQLSLSLIMKYGYFKLVAISMSRKYYIKYFINIWLKYLFNPYKLSEFWFNPLDFFFNPNILKSFDFNPYY